MKDDLRVRWAFARHDLNRWFEKHVLWKIPLLLPHKVVTFVVTYVGAATIRDSEVVPEARFMDLVGRWDRRELTGRAAARHPTRTAV